MNVIYQNIQQKGLRNKLFGLLMLLAMSIEISAQARLSVGCITGTADLSGITAANLPANTMLTWHSGTPVATANKISNITALVPGTYYAAFFDATNSCYSSTETTVTLTTALCLNNICPSAVVNLNSAVSVSNLPSNTVLSWHTSLPATDANKVADPTMVATNGTYYAVFYDATNTCYSGNGNAATEVIVTIGACSPDSDNDGITDNNDLDDDNDGILDTDENSACSPSSATCDTDGDLIPNRLDLDSDNDGINDVLESEGTDSDFDGKADGASSLQGIPSSAGTGTILIDYDGDTRYDPYDLDTDNDGINDLVESGNALLIDATGDGIVDGTDPDNDGIRGAADGSPDTRGDTNDAIPPDTDSSGGPNYKDEDSDDDGLTDLAESGITNIAVIDADNDGKIDNNADADRDGIPQVVDGAPTVFGDANNPTLPDTNNNGTPNYVEINLPKLIFSVASVSKMEGNSGVSSITFTVIRADNPSGVTTVDWAVTASGLNPVDANDFGGNLPAGTLTFNNGESSKDIIISISGDYLIESNETFTITLSNPSTPAILGAVYTAIGVIQNDDLIDTDGDSITDAVDLDDDNDGILDTTEDAQLTADVDGDGVPNRLDLDSDNDGINDVIEAGGTDADKNGQADGAPSATGIPATAGTGDDLVGDDADGDTRPNPYDLDSDNDGINDLVESGNPALVDATGDGIVDGTDPDKDGIVGAADATPTAFGDSTDPSPVNTDGTTTPDYLDLDSDNDGLTDLAESGIPNVPTLDANGDGKIDNPADADGDGIPQVVDGAPTVFGDANNPTLPDTDADGNPDYTDPTDTDKDGIADADDLDDDNDGILDTTEDAQLTADVDGDGVPNRLDLDSDNDGINDVIEAGGTDADKNGQADGAPSATGIPATAGTGDPLTGDDADGDTRPNPYDLDSDNDGINDLVESGNPALVDATGDGIVDGTDPDKDGIVGAADTTPTAFGDSNDPSPVNTDGTTTPDYLDLDSDNDGLTDLAESGIANVPTLDANGDGKIDNPADADGDGIPQVVDGAPTVFGDANNPTLPDGDNDGNPDYTDPTDSDKDGVADAVDLDDDNDGILDTTEDAQLTADVDGDGVPNRLDLDSDNDGINDVIEVGGTDADKNGVADGLPSATGIPASAGTGDLLVGDDADGDTRPNPYDLDSDNDGINDLVESGNPLLIDANGDGKVDGTDVDSDGIVGAADATPTTRGDNNDPSPANTDGTTTPNYIDLDSDDDGLTDLVESGLTNIPTLDANNDGKIDNDNDTDGDGIPQVVDGAPAVFGDANNPTLQDTDNNGTPDYVQGNVASLSISITNGTKAEGNSGNTPFVFTIIRGSNPTGTTTVNWAVTGTGTNPANVSDFGGSFPNGTVTFLNGESSKDITVNVSGDAVIENDETFTVTLSNATAPAVISVASAVATIQNDDLTDTDGDTIIDTVDLDDDNDGILDTTEDAQLTVDVDGDSVPNRLDLDSDNDGINDVIEAGGTDADKNGIADGTPNAQGIPATAGAGNDLTGDDADNDTRPNPYDLDSDNDGINDLVESGNPVLTDTNGDGKVDGTDPDSDGILGTADAIPGVRGDSNDPAPTNTDTTGTPNYLDLDSDDDGLTDLAESGIANVPTLDADGDGKIDDPADADGDGIPQVVDGAPAVFGDANNPTLPDTNTNNNPDYTDPIDTDRDGIPNLSDLDDDNDGITDIVELATAPANGDTDGDGIKDSLDLDADNDGINDVIEAGGTDANKDGQADGIVGTTPTTLGIPATAGTGVIPDDTDGDGQKNFQDLDSDNDAWSDLIESGNPLLIDADNDGLVDGTDPDKDGIVGPADGFTNWGDGNDPTPINIDGDTMPNYTDLDSDNDTAFDIVEGSKKPTLDVNNDGKIDSPIDADKDGVADIIDNKPGIFGGIGAPDSDGDGIPDSIDIDDDNDGVLDTVEGLVDSDGDGVPNSLDLDSDNDGINDVRESTLSSVNIDTNNDGMKDGAADPVTGLIGTATTPVNTDNDANVDMLDLDTDNDAISDLVESGNPALIDANKDGVVDGNDLDGDGILTSADSKSTFGDQNDPLPKNTDNADEPDYRDLDSNNNGANDITEGGYAAVDSNSDGRIDNPADTDNDGIANAVDNKPTSWGGLSPKSSIALNIKALLQGGMFGIANTGGSGGSSYSTTMRDDLRVANRIPLSDPYRTAPYNAEFLHVLNPNTQTTTAAVLANADPNNAIVDWVFIELRNANNPSSVVVTMSALIQRDGDVVKASDGISPVLIDVLPDNYYVAIRHRNHLGAMTATALALDITPINVDFTAMTNAQVYNSTATYEGYEMIVVNGKKALWAGNCNMDTKVKYAGLDNDSNVNLTEVLNSVGNTSLNYSYNNCLGYFRGDVNMDGKSKYSGLNNDINYILNNIFNYGLNSSKNYSYNLLVEQLP